MADQNILHVGDLPLAETWIFCKYISEHGGLEQWYVAIILHAFGGHGTTLLP